MATVTLTPAQFQVARTLASAFSHLWSSVPDGTLDLDAIEAYGMSIDDSRLPGGITSPSVINRGDFPVVVHTTGSGRLHWEIETSGNVTLSIFRPADLSLVSANAARTFAYAAISSIPAPAAEGIEVARVQIINDNPDRFQFDGDYIIHASSLVSSV